MDTGWACCNSMMVSTFPTEALDAMMFAIIHAPQPRMPPRNRDIPKRNRLIVFIMQYLLMFFRIGFFLGFSGMNRKKPGECQYGR